MSRATRNFFQAVLCSLLLAGSTHAEPSPEVWQPRTDGQAAQLLLEVQQLQSKGEAGSTAWAQKLHDLIQLGESAVPDLCQELEAVPELDRFMLRTIPFVLRGIGDPRAVPSLIRTFPLGFGRDGSDMGYRCDDPQLLEFLLKHDCSRNDRHDDSTYSFGRPTREISSALQVLTQQSFGEDGLSFVWPESQGPSLRNNLGRKAYHKTAEKWAAWWNEHSTELVGDLKYQRVELAPLVLDDETLFPKPDKEKNWSKLRTPMSGSVCASMESKSDLEINRCLYDIDTGRYGGLPSHLGDGDVSEKLGDILNWAADEGYDLLGDQFGAGEEAVYFLRPVGLKVWEIPLEWKKSPNRSFNDMVGTGRVVESLLVARQL